MADTFYTLIRGSGDVKYCHIRNLFQQERKVESQLNPGQTPIKSKILRINSKLCHKGENKQKRQTHILQIHEI